MTSEITDAMVEAAGNELIGYGADHGWFRCPATMTEFFEHDPIGHSEFQAIVAQVIEAALAARPAPEAGSVVGIDAIAYRFWSIHPTELDGLRSEVPEGYKGGVRAWFFAKEMQKLVDAATTEANEKIERLERLERERDEEIARAMAKADYEAERAGDIENENDALLDRASELQREVERLRKAIDDALGRHQVTHIHADLRAALAKIGGDHDK